MKKLLSVTLAAIMAVSLASFPALAEDVPNLPADSSVAYTGLKGKYGSKTSDLKPPEIPVYGYVGPTDEIIDTNPEDPDTPPQVVEVNVSVPVKIIWAAFEDGGGAITSPEYYIKNNSGTRDLKVTLLSFLPRADVADNASVDGYLTLNLAGETNQFGSANTIVSGSGGVPAYPVDGSEPNKTIVFANDFLHDGTQWKFNLNGTWGTTFPSTHYKPVYDMVLKFGTTDP
ncbi:MAG: hypothetical protein LBJ84_06360 [Oscillospiraceae bacterium]|jgi:hypothetical protein|nr:hypothetical protein [Oscillospiraceae bacterium]